MKNYKSLLFKFIILILCPLISCEETVIEKEREGKVYTIEGFAQKGPFIVGTDVTVAELNDKLFPTGRVFFATILDDKGRFALPGVVLESPYVQIKIRGKYYSEVWGSVHWEELTLFSFADVRKSETINVNIITHLESERVAHLVQKENLSFDEAKAKAFKEFLAVFEWEDLDVASSELLDLSKNDEGGAVLLATASIFERVQDDYVRRLETITNFRIDFTDGKIDEPLIQNRLRTAVSILDEQQILQNLEYKYGDIALPDFGSLLEKFKDNSPYIDYHKYIDETFPTEVDGKINFLKLVGENLVLNPNEPYYILINPPTNLPNAQLSFNIELNDINTFSVHPDPDIQYYKSENSINGAYRYNTDSQIWSQKSIPITFTAGTEFFYSIGRCGFSFYVDGFLLLNTGFGFYY